MTLDPLLTATFAIKVHALAAVIALIIGAVQLMLPKGGFRHRIIGWCWVILMVLIALSSFWISEINQYRGYSLIHLLSLWTLMSVPIAIIAIRRGNVSHHKAAMKSLYFFALVVAGIFTLMPGRVMYEVFFGT